MWLLAAIALTTGVLEVRAEYGATVSVDRQPRGVAPIAPVPVAAGLHLVEVWRRGTLPWTRLVFVGAGERVIVQAAALHAPPPAPVAAGAPATAPAPAWRLAATAGLAFAQGAEGADLDLVQRWHVAGDAPFGPASHVRVTVLGRTDVAGPTRLLRQRDTARDLTLVEAAAGGRAGPVDVRAGRLLGQGPALTLLVLDGAHARFAHEALAITALAGARADPGAARPTEPATAGLGLRLDEGAWAAGVEATYQARPHVEASARGALDALRADARATLVGAGELLQTRATLGLAGLSAHHRFSGRARSPFTDLRPDLAVVAASAPGHELGLALDATSVRADLATRLGDRRALLGLIGARRDALGVELQGLLADAGPVRGRLLLALDATARWGPARLRGRLGLGALDLEDDRGDRLRRVLPEAGADVELALAPGLSVAGAAGVQAVHPTVLPGGGPLVTAGLELRLR